MVLKLDKETLEQIQAMIDERVEQKLEEMLGDPDKGLEVRDEIIEKLKAQRKHRKKRIPGEEIMRRYGMASK